MTIKRIIVPVDFSSHSLNALAYARDIARRVGAELLLLHVVEPAYLADASDVYVSGPHGAVLLKEQWRLAKAQLTRLGGELTKDGYRVRSMVKWGAPAQVIVETAVRSRAHLIVMGTYGRTGLTHMLVGSVAERVVRTATCPVLTVRRPLAAPRNQKRAGRKVSARKRAR